MGSGSNAKQDFPPDPYRELIQISPHPFWRKPKYFRKLEEERAILVAVKSRELQKNGLNSLEMQGAGIVNRPLEQCYATLKEFSGWKEISDYVVRSDFDPKTKFLNLELEAFNYKAALNLRVFFDDKDTGQKAFRFLVVGGVFDGLKGLLQFKDNERRSAEISMTVYDEFAKLPLPDFFIEFGLEVVFQKMAERMRSFIEAENPRKEVRTSPEPETLKQPKK